MEERYKAVEKKMTPHPKPKTFRSEKFLEYIRSKPSLYSGRIGTEYDPIVAAHIGFGKGGTALKAPDTQAVPLLRSEHLDEHRGSKTFWGNQYNALPLRCLEYVTEYMAIERIKK